MNKDLKYLDNIGLERVVENTKKLVNTSYSNPNLLDNPNFADPINQRGQIQYTVSGYTIDRFYLDKPASIAESVMKIYDGGIELTAGDEVYHITFEQRLEPDAIEDGAILTFSVLLDKPVPGFFDMLFCGVTTDDVWLGLGDKNVIPADSTGLISMTTTGKYLKSAMSRYACARLNVRSNSTVYLKAMKLELGDKQTLAHQDSNGNWVLNDAPPNKALELVKCQRYLIEFTINTIWPPVSISNQFLEYAINLPCKMRAVPTIINEENLRVGDTDGFIYKFITDKNCTNLRLRAIKNNNGISAENAKLENQHTSIYLSAEL